MFYICVICLFTVHRSMLLYLTTFIVFLCHALTHGFTHILTDTTPILYIIFFSHYFNIVFIDCLRTAVLNNQCTA